MSTHHEGVSGDRADILAVLSQFVGVSLTWRRALQQLLHILWVTYIVQVFFSTLILKVVLAYDLGMLETPHPVRSAKLSNIQSWPDLDG